MQGVVGPQSVAANGPICPSADRPPPGDLDASVRALAPRGPSGEVALLGELQDPLCRSLAAVAGPPSLAAAGTSPSTSLPSAVVPTLGEVVALEEVVRRVAWGGDRRSGVARLELGGAHLGTAIVVRGAGREVALSIELARGSDAGTLPARLVERLRARGLEVTDVEVR